MAPSLRRAAVDGKPSPRAPYVVTMRSPSPPPPARPPLVQPARGAGYRVNVDAYHLARFAAHPSRAARRAFDLGAGVGAVGIELLEAGAAKHVVLVELDDHAAALARRNLEARGHLARGDVLAGDVLALTADLRGAADLVVCNPPYVEPGRGRAPSEPRRARARLGALGHFVRAARHVGGQRARVCFVYPAHEALTLLATLREHGLEPKRLQAVHARAGAAARIVLVEAVPGKPGGLAILPPQFEDHRKTDP